MNVNNLGITATRSGLTLAQVAAAAAYVGSCGTLHHGGAAGGDTQCHWLALAFRRPVVVYPSTLGFAKALKLADPALVKVHPAAAPLVRNRTIVETIDWLLVLPRGTEEELRSGTWATWRYAKKVGRQRTIIYPDGTQEER